MTIKRWKISTKKKKASICPYERRFLFILYSAVKWHGWIKCKKLPILKCMKPFFFFYREYYLFENSSKLSSTRVERQVKSKRNLFPVFLPTVSKIVFKSNLLQNKLCIFKMKLLNELLDKVIFFFYKQKISTMLEVLV